MDVKEMLMQSDMAVEKATMILYTKQTEEEKNCQNTLEQNGVGYNGVDAPIMTSFAQQMKYKGRSLSEPQLRVARRILPKYHKQLAPYAADLEEALQTEIKKDLNQLEIDAKNQSAQKPLQPEEKSLRIDSTQQNSSNILVKRCLFKDGKIWVRLDYKEVALRQQVKDAGFKWDPNSKMWYQPDDAVARVLLGLPLPDRKAVEVDTSMHTQLYDFQRADVSLMASMGSCLNANEMGLGKTLETLLVMKSFENMNKVLIVCTATLKDNWYLEFEKWNMLDVGEMVCVINGTPSQKAKQMEYIPTAKYVVVNYEQILSDLNPRTKKEGNALLALLQSIQWDMIVADEAHKIKNRKAGRSISLKTIPAKRKIALTGTPIQNRPHDLFSILEWIDPFYSSKSFWRFAGAFCELENNGFGVVVKGLTQNTKNRAALDRLLAHVMIRHEKTSVAKDLPEKMHQTLTLTMPTAQRNLYKQIQSDIEYELGNGEVKTIASMLTRLLRLQQLTSNPELFELKCKNEKFEAILDLLENTNKLIVYSRFEKSIEALAARLRAQSVEYAKITGATKDRQAEIDKFQKDAECQVFLGTIKAAGEGITLTAAHTVVFIDREWSPAQNLQAEDRAHRIGQKNAVQIIDLIYKNTIDEWVEKVLNQKLEDIVAIVKES